MIHFDSNAGAPLHPRVKQALPLFSDSFGGGNPSSLHGQGRAARKLLETARERVLRSIGVEGERARTASLSFTSSGAEANQWAIRSALARGRGRPVRWALPPIEHASTLALADVHAGTARIEGLPVSKTGAVEFDHLDAVAAEAMEAGESLFCSLLLANNETGITSHIQERVSRLRLVHPNLDLWVHVDAIAAWGKIGLSPGALGCDSLALSGHKIGAPAGVGALWARDGNALIPLLPGSQERGKRAGTENLLGAHLMGVAAETVPEQIADQPRLAELRDGLEARLADAIPGIRFNGRGSPRIANTSNFSVPGLKPGLSLVALLDLRGFCVSAGSACEAAIPEPSHVLLAMGVPPELALHSVRVSLPSDATVGQIERFVDALSGIVRQNRRE